MYLRACERSEPSKANEEIRRKSKQASEKKEINKLSVCVCVCTHKRRCRCRCRPNEYNIQSKLISQCD